MSFFKKATTKIKHPQALGNSAENIARQYVSQQGLKFIANNFSCKRGEIDLIFKDGDTLVFIEVRYRNNTRFGSANETVTHKKQQKIIQAARYYLHLKQLTESVNCRFDIIGIEPKNNNTITDNDNTLSIDWIKNAFYAN